MGTPRQNPSVRYRVEHHAGGEIASLGMLADVPPHHATLAPFVSALLLRGAEGEVVLVEEASGRPVARRRVRPFGTGPRARSR
jgi:hypothetical protein